jgi:hypothetical protein
MNFVAYSLLRDQLAVLQRQKNRVSLGAADRLLWVLLSRIWNQWRSALAVVKNSTPFGAPPYLMHDRYCIYGAAFISELVRWESWGC